MRPLLTALALCAAACTNANQVTQGPLEPQAVTGPCQVQRFFLLANTAVHTTITVSQAGGTCAFTLINPNLQVFPTAALVTQPAARGRATAALVNGGRSASITYTPAGPGPDQFTVTILPNDRTVIVAVAP